MRNFSYKGKDRKGKKVKGSFQAETLAKAKAELRGKGYRDVTISELKPKTKKSTDINITWGPFGKVSTQDMLIFTKKLSTMIRSGLPILDSLILTQSQTKNKVFANVIGDVINSVNSGVSFSASLSKHPRYFDEVYRNMIEAGEISGKLDQFLDRVVEGLERMQTIRSGIKSALFYPISLVVVTVLIAVFMLIKVVPTFVEIYGNMGVKLPGPTQSIVDLSNWLLDGKNMLSLIGTFILIMVIHRTLAKYFYLYRKFLSALYLKLPIFGEIIVKASVARMSLLMANLFAAGIGIDEILRVASRTTTNLLFIEAMERIGAQVVTGKELSVLFAEEEVFPIELSQLIKVGEKTGGMEEMLTAIAKYYQEEFEAVVKGLTTVIEPLMIVFIGGVIGMLVVALYLPIFSAGDAIGGGK